MKKLLSFVIVALALILVGCTQDVTTNARAVVTSIIKTSTEASFRVELKDPNEELDSQNITVELLANNLETKTQSKLVDKITLFKFESLEKNTDYTISIKGFIEGKEVSLHKTEKAFTTLNIGETIEDPILISNVEDFKQMNSKKHYKLTKDIDFENKSMAPLFTAGVPFNGSFDGAGFALKNINIVNDSDVSKSNLSIFGTASKAIIKNLTLDNVKIDNSSKPYSGISYIGLLVGKVTNNSFEMDNITVINSGITVKHNQGDLASPRNLYVGLLAGSVQGKFTNISIVDSTLKVSQNSVNGLFDGNDGSTTGTYVGGAIGMIEMDKGLVINKISVMDTTVDVSVEQLRSYEGNGLLHVGGVLGAYKSDKLVSELVSNATITVNHKKHQETLTKNSDTVFIGGLIGNIVKANAKELVFTGVINITASHPLFNANVGLVAGLAALAGDKIVASGQLVLNTLDGLQENIYADVYTKYITWDKYENIRVLDTTAITYDSVSVSLVDYVKIQTIAEYITSDFIKSKLQA